MKRSDLPSALWFFFPSVICQCWNAGETLFVWWIKPLLHSHLTLGLVYCLVDIKHDSRVVGCLFARHTNLTFLLNTVKRKIFLVLFLRGIDGRVQYFFPSFFFFCDSSADAQPKHSTREAAEIWKSVYFFTFVIFNIDGGLGLQQQSDQLLVATQSSMVQRRQPSQENTCLCRKCQFSNE